LKPPLGSMASATGSGTVTCPQDEIQPSVSNVSLLTFKTSVPPAAANSAGVR
jgi:hypothetical protein